MKHASLFTGIGGFDLAAEWVGWTNVFAVEKDKWCRNLLQLRFPATELYDDIYNFSADEYYGKIDVISGGVPCQPFSVAGKQKGKDDERYLWDEYIRVIRECLPQWIVAENVPGLLTTDNGRAYENISLGLENEGYELLPILLPACSVGAPHQRERIWIIGRYFMEIDTNSTGGQLGEIPDKSESQRSQSSTELSGNAFGFSWYDAVSGIHRANDGLSTGMDKNRNRTLGNSIVPQIAYNIFSAIQFTNNNLGA